MNYVRGKFRKIIFENNTGFKIGLFKVLETDCKSIKVNKTITYTGYFNEINDQDIYILNGDYVKNANYGYQLNVVNYEKTMPTEKEAIIEFLTSSFVKGCGKSTANKIYDLFKEDTINKIKENKNNLLLIDGLTDKKIDSIYNSVLKYFENDQIILELKNMGFTVKETMDLVKLFGNKIIDIINDNIYELALYVPFKKLDTIFLNNNDKENIKRVRACIIETIKYLSFETGDIYLYKDEIIEGINRLYLIESNIDNEINYLYNKGKITIVGDKIYLRDDYLDEMYIAKTIKQLINNNKQEITSDKIISKTEKELGIKYNEEQKNAIISSLNNNISVITGGPGTGKTTIIKGIIKSYCLYNKVNEKELSKYVLLLAPTGKASKRMSSATSYPASTIHRFLKWDKISNTFNVNESCKEHYSLIIVDEVSMVDNHLMASLLRGLSLSGAKIVFVGDEFQLPSVGPGLVLNDLIETNIPHIRLEYIYRQSDKSYIPMVAKNIKDYSNEIVPNGDDFCFIECSDRDIKPLIIQLLDKMKSKNILDSKIQILAPMYKGENGIDNINVLLQDYFNPLESQNQINFGEIVYREGDKVLNLVNDLDNNIFNGDTGFIDKFYYDGKKLQIIIDYDGNKVLYNKEDLINITHAYAITIHKAQGSEFDYVIMPISLAYRRMLYNKLLYTGVSRAKKSLIIIGSKEAYMMAVNNNYSFKRKTTLSENIMNYNL